LTRKDVVDASDRHEQEAGDSTWKKTIEQRIINHQNPDVDSLCKNFLIQTPPMTDRQFEDEFNRIIRLDPVIMQTIGDNKMDFLASNILMKLKHERAEYMMVDAIDKSINNYKDQASFGTDIRNITNIYFNETQKSYPDYIQNLLKDANNPTNLRNIINHQKAIVNTEIKNLQMQLQLLDKTT
jgi:hypothetical protein